LSGGSSGSSSGSSDSGMADHRIGGGGTAYSKQDAARDTGVSVKHVSGAWHDAKDAAAKEGGWSVPAGRHSSSSDNSSGGGSSSGK